jgi:transcriptional accessory protein Tex/SPT6
MILEGVVTNVTNFGAFVDIGVHQDGLCTSRRCPTASSKTPTASSRPARW